MLFARTLLITAVFSLLVVACSASPDPVLLAAGGEDPRTPEDEPPTLVITPTVPTLPVETTTTIASTSVTEPSPDADIPLVIFDTDMGPDVDDVLALAMLHSYEKRGMIELAAVTVSRDSAMGAKYSDAVNTFYGRPDIPIGMYYGGTTEAFDDSGTYVSTADSWPNDIANDPIQPGYKIQREVLARGQETGRDVLIIQTGFSGNVKDLLWSQPDEFSDLTGRELISETVPLLSIMAGAIEMSIVEFNVEKDIEAARQVFDQWPTRLALSPFELGNAILYPYSSITSDFGWADRHPVREAYEFKDLGWHQDRPPYYDMRSWDLTSVMEAIEPDSNYFFRSETGRVRAESNGRTYFAKGEGQHYVLDRFRQYSGEQRQRIIDRMIELTSDQP